MLKKILTYILSLTLITSHCYAVKGSTFQKSKFTTNQIDKSYYFQGDDEFFDEFDEENLMKKEGKSKQDKLNWILGSSISTVLALVLTAPLVSVEDNKIEKLIKKLEKENIKVNDKNILCELTCSTIQGLGYIEGKSRNVKANKELLFKLVKNLVFLKAYDKIDKFFHLDVYKTDTNPDLLTLSRTQGDDMISEHGHDEGLINKQMNESNVYIEKIKEKFDNLSMSKAFDALDLYSDKTDKNMNAKLALLDSLTIINMKPEKLENLIKGVVNDS